MKQHEEFTIASFAGIAELVKRITHVYMAFSVITAIAFVVIRIDQAVMQIVLVNTQITAAFGFMVSGIAGLAGALSGKKLVQVILSTVAVCVAYLLVFVLGTLFLKILGGFSI